MLVFEQIWLDREEEELRALFKNGPAKHLQYSVEGASAGEEEEGKNRIFLRNKGGG